MKALALASNDDEGSVYFCSSANTFHAMKDNVISPAKSVFALLTL